MVNSAKNHPEDDEFDDADVVSLGGASASHSLKVEGRSGEPKAMTTPRSKHSETEQRRRSKINERFQRLRDLIPQNDQKRDKASFLLEVIQYIQFLKEKLNVYEGSYEGWSNEPAKLIPWRNHGVSAENFTDHSHLLKNGSGQENSIVIPDMVPNAHNSVESDLGRPSMDKGIDHSHGLVVQAMPINMQLQPPMFAPAGRSGLPTQHLQEPIFDAESMASRPQSHLWQSTTECDVSNNTSNEQELKLESDSVSISNVYSQGVLNTLTQVLQSSGVDLSQASISVQIDVGKRENGQQTATVSCSKDHRHPTLSAQEMAHSGVAVCREEPDQAYKRPRTEKC